MTRDKALATGIARARQEKTIVIVFNHNDSGHWLVMPYPYTHVECGNDVRYVLPNGEVTKLS